MSFDAGLISVEWVAVGAHAFGLVLAGHVVALVYWQSAGEPELGAVSVGSGAGFAWLPTDLPVDRFFLFEAPSPGEHDWTRARELAADAYLEWMLREAEHTDELRREAAALLSRSRWKRDERLRGHLLTRAWRRPRKAERD